MTEVSKIGIEETLDVIAFTDAYLESLKVAKANDGKIDMAETLAAIGKTKSEAFKAALGAWNMTKELKDLDQSEKDELLDRLLGTLFKIGEVIAA